MREKEKGFDIKFYQKLFILLISLSTILIFPESPKNWKIYVKFITLENYVMFGNSSCFVVCFIFYNSYQLL